MDTIEITFNGEQRAVRSLTVAALLEECSLHGKTVAVELNRQIVPRTQHASTPLQAGDQVEVVHFVGGG